MLFTKEVAELFDVESTTVRVWVHRGNLKPESKKSGVLLFGREEIKQYANETGRSLEDPLSSFDN
ncbi:helix-turn-helix domain-containing protein [Salinibacter ruber]|jgi:predicted site-specific integrase-resolvase|uniref:helix-turn-helix domain-containing protein n=1 Tax=Salinibacter ruber TaxID=146919 RepID=UPI000E58C95D